MIDRTATWAVVPAFNECATIEAVVQALKQHQIHVIVVDDGSTDDTGRLACEADADLVISLDRNQGYDAALKIGSAAALGQANCQWIAYIDADGQHRVDDLVTLIGGAVHRDMFAAIGVRPQPARWSEALVGWISRRLFGIADPLCGMKALRFDCATKLRHVIGDGLNTEALICVSWNHPDKVFQMPIDCRPRIEGASRFGDKAMINVRILYSVMCAFTTVILRPRWSEG